MRGRKRGTIWRVAAAVVFIIGITARTEGATLFSDTFDRTGTDLGPNWSVAAGSFSTNGGQAVSGGTNNWAKLNVAAGTDDYQVEAVITPPANSSYSGLVARGDAATGYSDLYAAQVDVVGQKINLYRRNAVAWTLLQGIASPVRLAAGNPYKLKLEVSGSSPVVLKVYFQETLLISYTDASAGRILSGNPGLENYNRGVLYDQFHVYSLETAVNKPPSASFSLNPASGQAPLKVTFDASLSFDPDGSIAMYVWDFGDGTAGSGQIVDHTYSAGSYTATLTVTDNNGAQGRASHAVSVESADTGQTILFEDGFNRVGTALGTGWRLDAGSFRTDGTFAVSAGTGGAGGPGSWAAATASPGISDYAVESVMTVPAGSLYSGIVVRGDNSGISGNNYVLQVSTAGTLNLYRRNTGAWTLLKSAAAPGGIAANTPYKIKLSVKGINPTRLEASFQETLLFTHDDSSAGQRVSGLPGIQNYDAGVRYDTFTVYGARTAGNSSPAAKFTCAPTSGTVPLAVSCDASASSDPDGSIASYAWDFGNGTTGTGVTAGQTYQNQGNFIVTLVVTDTGGAQGTATGAITVHPAGGGGTSPPAGQGWNLATRVPGDLKGVHFVDADTGWVVGLDMAIFKTTDGGASWIRQNNIAWKGTPPGIPPVAFDVFFLDRNKGWIAGLPELILYTEDGGNSWVEQKRNPISPKDGKPYNSANYCEFFDSDGNCNIYYGTYLRRIRFAPDGLTGYAVGRYRYIYKTIDGGKNWTLLPFDWKSPNWNPDPVCPNPDDPNGGAKQYHFTAYNPHLFSVAVLSPNELFIVGGAAGTFNCPDWFNTIAHSADGGKTWDFKVDLDRRQRFFDIHFIGDTGWIVGGGGTILRTTDHGRNWTVMNPNRTITSVELLGLAFPAPDKLWAVGSNGVIIHTKDGGVSWQVQPSKTTRRLERVSFIDAFRGWAAAHLGFVTRTGSGGN